MDAIILVGGEGTRLLPLTLAHPKPVLPLVDRPFLAFQFAQLRRAGVTRVILGCGYLPGAIQGALSADGARWRHGLDVEYAVEPEPLGTAGAIRFAASGRSVSDTLLVLNGDILSDHDLGELLQRHRAGGGRATIALTPVEDPTRYGLVRTDARGRVLGFLEKPRPDEIDTDLINAGTYVLERDVLEAIPDGRVSIERQVFPSLIGDGLQAFRLDGSWIDIGTPESYLAAHAHLLGVDARAVVEDGAVIEDGARLVPPVWIGRDARIESGASVCGSAIGRGAVVGRGSVVEGAVMHDGARMGPGCELRAAVVGSGASVGGRSRLGGLALVGPGVSLPEGSVLHDGMRVFPQGAAA